MPKGKSRSKAMQALQQLMATRPTGDEMWRILSRLNPTFTEVDETSRYDARAVAIVGTAILEDALELAIASKFVPLQKDERQYLFGFTADGAEGPIASLATKIRIGHALDIFGNTTKADLIVIQRIRNAFAHAVVPIDFETEEISMLCDLLNFHKRPLWNTGGIGGPRPTTSQGFFIESVSLTES
jgi:hypothetical protein